MIIWLLIVFLVIYTKLNSDTEDACIICNKFVNIDCDCDYTDYLK